MVVAVRPAQVIELAAVATLDAAEFEALASEWVATDEFVGWSVANVRELLRELGDLAEFASLGGECLWCGSLFSRNAEPIASGLVSVRVCRWPRIWIR